MNLPAPISFSTALRFWFKLGFISFGGPAGQIAIMHQELVERRRWISEQRFLHALNYCMLLPGPEAQQLATYLGWLMHRTLGGVLAGVLFIFPSLILIIFLSWLCLAFGHTSIVAGIFYGIKPAVAAIVFQAAYRISTRVLNHKYLWMIAIGSFLSIFIFNLAFPLIILIAALIGYWGGKKHPQIFAMSHPSQEKKSYGFAWIDDNTPTPEHAQFKWWRLIKIAIAGAVLWLGPMALIIYSYGWKHTFSQMAWFFTKAALLTFGGAYAVLPYVYQGAVSSFHWLSATQMMDGLALGETTPGPLIMIVAFVGFVGGYTKELLGHEQLFLAGAIASMVVTWFTFLPSFIFIFLGGPFIESTHNNLNFTAPLTAISAAVVGVIVNLAIFFGYHVLWPLGIRVSIDWVAALICIFSMIALFKYKLNVINLIITCGLLGLLTKIFLF